MKIIVNDRFNKLFCLQVNTLDRYFFQQETFLFAKGYGKHVSEYCNSISSWIFDCFNPKKIDERNVKI